MSGAARFHHVDKKTLPLHVLFSVFFCVYHNVDGERAVSFLTNALGSISSPQFSELLPNTACSAESPCLFTIVIGTCS